MSMKEFFAQLQEKGVRLFAENGKPCCEGPKEVLIEELIKIGDKANEVLQHLDIPTLEEVHPVFMFPGQGTQYPNMALGIYQRMEVFRNTVDRISEFLLPILEMDLREILFPKLFKRYTDEEAAAILEKTEYTQPALFAVHYGLAQLWTSLGIKPSALIGHSFGEYVAATVGGMLDWKDALQLVITRGRLTLKMEEGRMMAVTCSKDELEVLLSDELAMAAHNSTNFCVVSGPKEEIEEFHEALQFEDIPCRILKISHASHSPMLNPILDEFREETAKLKLSEPKIPYISNVTGTWITKEQWSDSTYFATHFRSTVLFDEGLSLLLEDQNRIYLEVGPGVILSSFLKEKENANVDDKIITSLRHPDDEISDMRFLYQAVATAWLTGAKINWDQLDSGENS